MAIQSMIIPKVIPLIASIDQGDVPEMERGKGVASTVVGTIEVKAFDILTQ